MELPLGFVEFNVIFHLCAPRICNLLIVEAEVCAMNNLKIVLNLFQPIKFATNVPKTSLPKDESKFIPC